MTPEEVQAPGEGRLKHDNAANRRAPLHPYQGAMVNSSASDRLVVWLLVLAGSRYQSCAWTTAPVPGFW